MDVIGIGVPVQDLLVNIRELPRENEGTEMLGYSWQGGGKVPTAIVALARLGAETGMVGVVGGDVYGDFHLRDFARHGIDISRMIQDTEAETTFCMVLSDEKTHGRNIIGKRGNCRSLTLDDLDRDYICSGKYLHLAEATEVTRQAAIWAREAGIPVVFDADTFSRSIEDMVPLIDVFIASEFYYKALFNDENYEENCRAVQRKGPGTVVFTLGERGSVGLDASGYHEASGFCVDAVDTTGAGDVYHGAFIYGLLQGWELKEVLRFSNAVSAIKCTSIGGRAGIPTRKMAEDLLRAGKYDNTEIKTREAYYKTAIFHNASGLFASSER